MLFFANYLSYSILENQLVFYKQSYDDNEMQVLSTVKWPINNISL